MRPTIALACLLVLGSALGCSGATTPADAGIGPGSDSGLDARASDDAGADSPAPGDAGPGPDTGRDAGTDAALATDTGSVTDAGGTASFTVEIVNPYAYGNCFMGPPDPLMVSWTAHVTGPAGTMITLMDAKLRVEDPAMSYAQDQTLVVDVTRFAIGAGGTVDQDQRKTSGSPSVPVCSFCGDAVSGTLSLVYRTDAGEVVPVNVPITDIGCVF